MKNLAGGTRGELEERGFSNDDDEDDEGKSEWRRWGAAAQLGTRWGVSFVIKEFFGRRGITSLVFVNRWGGGREQRREE